MFCELFVNILNSVKLQAIKKRKIRIWTSDSWLLDKTSTIAPKWVTVENAEAYDEANRWLTPASVL